jgi:hypothetical protein
MSKQEIPPSFPFLKTFFADRICTLLSEGLQEQRETRMTPPLPYGYSLPTQERRMSQSSRPPMRESKTAIPIEYHAGPALLSG